MVIKRWSRRAVLLGSVGYLMAACTQGQAGTVAYSVGVSGEGNQVTLVQSSSDGEGAFVATVQSARGIGQASVAWWGKRSPHPLWFDLQLNGLEQFSLMWGNLAVHVSVNSMDQSILQRTQVRGEAEVEIAPASPYWMTVEVPSQQGASFRVGAPKAFMIDAPSLWAIAWIDFYR